MKFHKNTKYKFCKICGKPLDYKERARFSCLPAWFRGYCKACHEIYFSRNCRRGVGGKLRCGVCRRYFKPGEFYDEAVNKANPYGKKSACKICDIERAKRYVREKTGDELKKYYRNRRAKRRAERRREVAILHENYIRSLLARYSDLTETQIPIWAVEQKRAAIMLHREIRKARKEIKH